MNNKIKSLMKYVESLERRLEGNLDKELRYVLEIDLKKTKAKIEKLR